MKKSVQKPFSIEDLDHILNHTRDIWDDLRNARLFITGGTGFIGTWLLESFLHACNRLALKCQATVLTRSPDIFRSAAPHITEHSAISIVQGDVRTFSFPSGTFSHIIHSATETSPIGNPIKPVEKFTANIDGTHRVLDFAASSKISKLLFTSSGAVYGRQPSEITHLPETYVGAPETTGPENAYGHSKRASEFLCTAFAKQHGFDALIARCFTFVGPNLPLDSNYAIGNFIRDALQGKPVKINGDGTPYRSYLYTADLTIWLWTILVRGQSCYPYNVGSESDLTIARLAEEIVKIISPGAAIQIAKQPSPGMFAERYVPSTRRGQKELGLQELIKLNEAIQRTTQWYTS